MRNRSLVFVIVMSIITLGIYDAYWTFSTRNELVQKGEDVPSPWIIFLPIVGLLGVALLQIIGHFVLTIPSGGSGNTVLNILSVVIGIVSIVGILPMSLYWTWKYCKAVENVTNGGLTTGFNFAICLILGVVGVWFVWPAIAQNYFNKISPSSSNGPTAQPTLS